MCIKNKLEYIKNIKKQKDNILTNWEIKCFKN